MTHDELIDQVRASIEIRLRESNLELEPLEGERLLLNDGHYCGRTFEWPNARACWFIEEQQVKVFDSEGRLLLRYGVKPEQLTAGPTSSPEEWNRAA